MERKRLYRHLYAGAVLMAFLCGLLFPRVLPAACADNIYVFDVDKMLAKGDTVLIDVREPHEYGDCRIPGSVNIPLSALSRRAAEVGAEKTVIVYCASGRRSGSACGILEKQGIKAYSLTGGIKAYYNTGRQLEGSCEGAPEFRYSKEGKPIRSDNALPPLEPEIKGCK
jgi:rhodanese-related sulfurtransferase